MMTREAVADARRGRGPEHVHTSCGRELTVGTLALGDDRHPIQRIFIGLGEGQERGEAGWAGLTTAEARQLGLALLAQAAAAKRESAPVTGQPGTVTVRHISGDAFAVTARGHALLVDQPAADGGQDAAPTPTELLVASLASCVAFYAGRYLARHGLERAGLAVTAEFAMAADRPARVGGVRLRISAPALPAQRREALLAVASHCTVHNTLRHEPEVSIELG